MNEKVKAALDKAFEELKKLSPEEFRAALEEAKGSDIARLLDYGWHPFPKAETCEHSWMEPQRLGCCGPKYVQCRKCLTFRM